MKFRTRTSAVVVNDQKVLTFLAVDPHDGREFHFLPGGAIEADETAVEATIRETLEETGYRIRIEAQDSIDKEYNFKWNGEIYHSLTFFYRGYLIDETESPAPVNDASYNKKVVWVPIENVHDVFSYSEEIRQAVELLLR